MPPCQVSPLLCLLNSISYYYFYQKSQKYYKHIVFAWVVVTKNVSAKTIYLWLLAHEEFSQILRVNFKLYFFKPVGYSLVWEVLPFHVAVKFSSFRLPLFYNGFISM